MFCLGEELYSHYLFDRQVRYALGSHDFDEGHFELRTLYNFRRVLVEHEEKTGENLIALCTSKDH